MVKVTYVWKITLSRPWTFDNVSCRLCFISHLYWWSNSEVFVDVWLSLDKAVGEFSMVYTEKWVLWYDLGSIITISVWTSSTLQGLFWVFRIRFSLSVSRACLVTWKSAKKWYLMRMCISLMCPYRKVPIEAIPRKLRTLESNVKSFLLLINPENSEPPKVATHPKVARPKKISRLSFFNYIINIPNAFIVFQLQFIVKFLMYNYTNIFVHLQIYHDKALYN